MAKSFNPKEFNSGSLCVPPPILVMFMRSHPFTFIVLDAETLDQLLLPKSTW